MKLPDEPKTAPIVQMLHWIANPYSYMDSCAERYGDIFAAPLGKNFRPIPFVSNPQALQQFLSPDSKQFDAPGDVNGLFEPLLGARSAISARGERHRRERQLMMPPFHGDRMAA